MCPDFASRLDRKLKCWDFSVSLKEARQEVLEPSEDTEFIQKVKEKLETKGHWPKEE